MSAKDWGTAEALVLSRPESPAAQLRKDLGAGTSQVFQIQEREGGTARIELTGCRLRRAVVFFWR